MDKLIINGGVPLQGEVKITGAKNAVLGLIPAAILSRNVIVMDNVPQINDVQKMVNILRKLGVRIDSEGDVLTIDAREKISHDCSPYQDQTGRMRASYYLLGALLGRYHEAIVPLPGGCNIGDRPIDQHIKGFEALGAKVVIEHGQVKMKADRLVGTDIYLDVVSVGATINIMLAAVLAEGKTVIENVAKEPHIVDVANFLNKMGANIKGAGTDTIRIRGVEKLGSCSYSVVPDQITAGTYMMAAAATGGNVLVSGVIPKHMESVTAKLREMGAEVTVEGDGLRVKNNKERLKACRIKTLPYPGFPTDLQQPMAVLMAIAEGNSMIQESIFENRFKYVDELRKMGANITISGRIANITGVPKLSGTKIVSTDLRAGAAMVIAALVAEGESEVTGLQYIDRGYENLEGNFRDLGARIRRVPMDLAELDI
ncbi:UDP-N-acetylglucosamine 1-carboxyvinyltransferase [Pseudoramibacter alactolyticus ATCC 23263]|uniref:UDP-N-acetylglucosamine 1-carboxyvinyltransferase n=1 Tax=Pseudoramibacter alactolyticus ATCC 23263 TaxID=887929 RepID=E6MIQ0_9FIRM|nr:UDP-N-acetylglucosamine 1-carboxyvinyltransferase [Pseudoramibacter alactolyticus]EFV01146.1 UDP-N-acetylglucosamine 1-carboxyvinyltransferase [Pseudoramibacter alactolyticus ATCC 23263]